MTPRGLLSFFLVACLALVALPARAQPALPVESQAIDYGGVTILPGDVIDLNGGSLTYFNPFLRHGHVALYLGLDSTTGTPDFFDFQSHIFHVRGYSRIENEVQFLSVSEQDGHRSFDVFRLSLTPYVDSTRLFAAAEQSASKDYGSYDAAGGFVRVCSTVVAHILSQATGQVMSGHWIPDTFAKSRAFKRIATNVDVRAALDEAAARRR